MQFNKLCEIVRPPNPKNIPNESNYKFHSKNESRKNYTPKTQNLTINFQTFSYIPVAGHQVKQLNGLQ